MVEAGVYVSAKVLFSELAPRASLPQRWGRCKRRGEFNETKDAHICWFELPDDDEKIWTDLAPASAPRSRRLGRLHDPQGVVPHNLPHIFVRESPFFERGDEIRRLADVFEALGQLEANGVIIAT